jgi:hypothetical protein
LIVRVPADKTLEQTLWLKAKVTELLPGINVVVVAADQLLVYRPEGATP